MPGHSARLTLLSAIVGLLAMAAPAAASNLLYYGGPVVHAARIVLVKWGPDVRASYTNPRTGDPGFLNYLARQDGSTSDIGGVLAQYMDTTGHNSQNRFSFGGAFQINPSVAPTPPGKVLDSQIQTALSDAIRTHELPSPGRNLSTVYAVLFPPRDNVCFDNHGGCAFDSGGFCAYHGSFQLSGATTQVLYAAMVDNGPGSANYGGCGVGVNSDVGNQTSVVSHELSEAINDPLDQVTSWYDYSFDGEIADRCDGTSAGSNGPWTVERLWSDRDKACESGEPVFHAPTASFLAPSTGTAGLPVSFNAAGSTDPSGNEDSALNQNNHKSFSISSGIVTYSWNWGDGSSVVTRNSASARHKFAASGNYEVSLTVTDRLGFTSTKTQEVSVASATPGTPLVTTGSASAVSDRLATLNGTINPQGETVSYRFLWGSSPRSLTKATQVTSGPAGESAVPVSATVSGLAASTTYYFQLLVNSAGGHQYLGAVHRFETTSSSPPPQTPVVGTGPAGRVSSSGALLTGTINPGGSSAVRYFFAYGSSSSTLDRTTAESTEPGGTTASLVSATLTGLRSHKTYYFRLIAAFKGHRYVGAVRSFTTTAPVPGVTTGGASGIAGNSATLSGWVNPHGSSTIYQIQYGPTSRYGYSTTWITGGSGTSLEHVQIAVFGLNPGTKYHYRLVAQNDYGTAVGADKTFTSAERARSAPRFSFRAASHLARARVASHPLRVRFACSRECRAHFILLVQPPDHLRSVTLPLAVGRVQGGLHRAGSGELLLRLSQRFRRRLSRSTGELEFELAGYASSPASAPSPLQQVTVRLTG